LELFDFVGRMLGKAVFEGIVVEAPFAPFFVNAFLSRVNSLNELALLDPELSKNLAFVKNYTGDFADLDLSFAVDDIIFGQHVSTPLIPGGTGIIVGPENRILYCHLMADFRLNKFDSI
jgi:ubiquitin-protein ligase E3 B